jgi:hypothetical protein
MERRIAARLLLAVLFVVSTSMRKTIMKARFAFVPALLLLSSLYTSQAVAQQPQQWSRTVLAPTVYSQNTDNSSFFSPSGMLPAATITNVTWNAGLYTNGATSQTVQLCFTPPYGSTPSCRNIRNELTGATTQFNGQNVRGSAFRITYQLQGGTYPVNPTFSNTLTVTYQ